MPYGVTRNNWYKMAGIAIERLEFEATNCAAKSFDEQTLLIEISRIQEMMQIVRMEESNSRIMMSSHLLAVHARDQVHISDDLLELLSGLSEVYRRWYLQLQPAS